jgi:hypothetical protein
VVEWLDIVLYPKQRGRGLTIVSGICTAVIVMLLTVVLRGEEPKGAGRHIVGIRDYQSARVPGVIKDCPGHWADQSGTGGAIKALDASPGGGA